MQPTLFSIPFPWLSGWLEIPVRGYGLMLMIGFLGGTWWAARRAVRIKADPDVVVNAGFIALVSSIIGARLFYVLHYYDEHFAGKGIASMINITAGGLEFYGGFIAAAIAVISYLYMKRVSVRLFADICTPSVMFGMSMARIGCFLNGCCWGAVCIQPIAWDVHFPFASPAYQRQWIERLVTVPAELLVVNSSGQAYPLPMDWLKEARKPNSKDGGAQQANFLAKKFKTTTAEMEQIAASPGFRSLGVHPAQLYASIDGLLLAILLNVYFYRRRRDGMVFALLLMCYPVMRVIEEIIRSDNPHDVAGLTISQFVSLCLFACGLALAVWLRKQPAHSPLVAASVPVWMQEQPGPAKKNSAAKRR